MLGMNVGVMGAATKYDIASAVRSLFASSERGVWYDPSDFSTLYQDSAGTTPVTAVGQPVGLMLDKSQGLVRGVEEVTNGGFDADSGWSKGPGWTIANGMANANNASGAFSGFKQDSVVEVGKTYQLKLNVVSTNGKDLNLWAASNQLIGKVTTAGEKSFIFTSAYTGNLHIEAQDLLVASIDNVSVHELPGYHATQPTAASRPVLSARVNLLTATETLATQSLKVNLKSSHRLSFTGTGSVTLSGATSGSLAGTGADVRVSSDFTLNPVLPTPAAPTVTTSTTGGTLGAGVATSYRIVATDGSGKTLASTAGTVTTDGASLTNSNTISWTSIANATGYEVYGRTGGSEALMTTLASGTTSWVDDGSVTPSGALPSSNTTGVTTFTVTGTVTKADVRVVTDAGASVPVYQRVTSATDYDTASFPHFLEFDGVDDFLKTQSIDFSATDKMTVVAGVRKMSDAESGTVVELSSSTSDNNGGFAVWAPLGAGAATLAFRNKGTAIAQGIASAKASPVTAVLSGIGDIGGDVASIRVDGVLVATDTADAGTGTYGNYPLYIGRRGGSSLPFNGRIYQLLIRAARVEYGPEMVTNGTFDTADGWTVGTWVISGGVATKPAGSASQLYRAAGIQINKTYEVTFTVLNRTAGSVTAQVGAWNNGPAISSNGTFTQIITASHANTTGDMVWTGDDTFDGSLDNISVREVTQTATSTPQIEATERLVAAKTGVTL
jgi:hypothetical protein